MLEIPYRAQGGLSAEALWDFAGEARKSDVTGAVLNRVLGLGVVGLRDWGFRVWRPRVSEFRVWVKCAMVEYSLCENLFSFEGTYPSC